MDEHRATGTAKNLGGKIEEGIGRIAGDMQTQAKGQARLTHVAATRNPRGITPGPTETASRLT
jgi:hypothetical protein